MRPAALSVFVLVVSSSCSLLPTRSPGGGRCVDNSDCGSGEVCDQATAYCVCAGPHCVDGGGAGSGMGGSGGAAGAAAAGSGGGTGAAGAAGQGAGGAAGGMDAGQDVNPCNACGGPTPVCLNSSCVECATSADCTGAATKPICNPTSHACVACTTDAQCSAKLGTTGNPGVCRSEIDGHCATDAETVYVQNTTGCLTSFASSGGTATAPYCSMEPVGTAGGPTKTLVVIRGTVSAADWTFQRAQGAPATTFVGQQSAVIAGGATPGFNMDSGTVYFRNLKFGPSPSGTVCIQATGGTLNVESVVVDSCQGGGLLLNGAAFHVENTTVKNNGPGTFMGLTTWGGILINNPPSAGPTTLNLLTVQNNTGGGVACSTSIAGASGVLVSGSSQGLDVNATCGFSSCGSASATCGAQ